MNYLDKVKVTAQVAKKDSKSGYSKARVCIRYNTKRVYVSTDIEIKVSALLSSEELTKRLSDNQEVDLIKNKIKDYVLEVFKTKGQYVDIGIFKNLWDKKGNLIASKGPAAGDSLTKDWGLEIEAWLNDIDKTTKSVSVNMKRRGLIDFKNYVVSEFNVTQCKHLTDKHVAAYTRHRVEGGPNMTDKERRTKGTLYTESTMNKILTYLISFYKHLSSEQIMAVPYFNKIKRYKKAYSKSKGILTVSQRRKFFSLNPKGEGSEDLIKYKRMICVGLASGQRWSDLPSIKKSNLSEDGVHYKIKQQKTDKTVYIPNTDELKSLNVDSINWKGADLRIANIIIKTLAKRCGHDGDDMSFHSTRKTYINYGILELDLTITQLQSVTGLALQTMAKFYYELEGELNAQKLRDQINEKMKSIA